MQTNQLLVTPLYEHVVHLMKQLFVDRIEFFQSFQIEPEQPLVGSLIQFCSGAVIRINRLYAIFTGWISNHCIALHTVTRQRIQQLNNGIRAK